MESGFIQFVNPIRTEPVVNILVTTSVERFNLSMNFVGPIDIHDDVTPKAEGGLHADHNPQWRVLEDYHVELLLTFRL